MRKVISILTLIMIVGLAGLVLAQTAPTGPGISAGGGKGIGIYDPKTLTTVKGPAESLATFPRMRAGRGGLDRRTVVVVLKTDQGPAVAHLGPVWYLQQENLLPQAGDKMEVTGSKTTLNGKPVIIARDFKANGRPLKLRDEQGQPLWPQMPVGGSQVPGAGKSPRGGQGQESGQ